MFPVSPSEGNDYTNVLGTVYTYHTDHWDITNQVLNQIQGVTGLQGSVGATGLQGVTGIGGSATDGTNWNFNNAAGQAQHISPQAFGSLHANLFKSLSVTANTWYTYTDQSSNMLMPLVNPSTANDNITYVVGADGVYQVGFSVSTNGTAGLYGVFKDGTAIFWSTNTGSNYGYTWYQHTADRLMTLTKDSTLQGKLFVIGGSSVDYWGATTKVYLQGGQLWGCPLYAFRVDR